MTLNTTVPTTAINKNTNATTEINVKPFIMWVGGKQRLLQKINKLTPKKIDNYYEPFLGGGSVLLNLLNRVEKDEISIKSFHVSDANEMLINTYKCIKNDVKLVLYHLNRLRNEYRKAKMIKLEKKHPHIFNSDWKMKDIIERGKSYVYYFYRRKYNKITKKRRRLNQKQNDPYLAALFIFINKTGFRGLYAENQKGENNVSFGHAKNPSIFSSENIELISFLLQKYRVKFKVKHFNVQMFSRRKLSKQDFIFLDPPYVPIVDRSIVKYVKEGMFDHKSVVNLCVFLQKKRIPFILCNSYTKFTKEFYIKNENFKTKIIKLSHTVNSKFPSKVVKEIMVTI